MTQFLAAIFLFSGLVSYAQTTVNSNQLYTDQDGSPYSGVFEEHYENGATKAIFEIKDGKLDGFIQFFSLDSKLIESGQYTEGKRDGKWTQWNAEGEVVATAYYKNGVKDGVWQVWDNEGIMRYLMEYEAGKRVNTWKMWDDNGNLTAEKQYE